MIDADMEALDKWQSSPEGNLEIGIYELRSAVVLLEAFSESRTGIALLREHHRDLVDLQSRLAGIAAMATPLIHLHAAE